MASTMPTSTYPKTYRVNGHDFTVKNAAEDTSFQADPRYHAAITVLTYPKTLTCGPNVTVVAKSATEESGARTALGQA